MALSRIVLSVLIGVSVILVSCSDEIDPLALPPEQRQYDTAQLLRGEQLYNQNCASCHGPGAVGSPNWRQRGADGHFPPPPLNGTAHTWHHPLAQVRHTIKDGGPPGQSNMPAWGAVLSDQEIDDIIAWFQSLWTHEVYAAWYRMEQRARANRG